MNIFEDVLFRLIPFVGRDYANALVSNEEFMDSVKEDIRLCSAFEETGYYSDTDVWFAIGRTILKKFGIKI